MDICFLWRVTCGEARVNDDESLGVGRFDLDPLLPKEAFTLPLSEASKCGCR